MRLRRQRQVRLSVALCAALAAAHCSDDTIGQPCGQDAPAVIPSEPIAGEDPAVEVVRMIRDRACASFQCLEHRGLPPYCTEPCKPKRPAGNASDCIEDSDCNENFICFNGKCREDTCPDGFECKPVQDFGPLSEQRFCVGISGCKSSLDCEDDRAMECVDFGCLDRCDMPGVDCEATDAPAGTDQSHRLVCDATVTCDGGDCSTSDCTPIAAGAAEARSYCVVRGSIATSPRCD